MSLEGLLSQDTVMVERQTVARDTSGGATRTWATQYDTIPARVRDVSSSQAAIYAQLQLTVTHEVITQQAGIQNGDRILTSDGVYIKVNGVEKVRTMGGIDTFYKVLGEELKPT